MSETPEPQTGSTAEPPATFPSETEIADAVERVASLRSDAREWWAEGEAVNAQFINNAVEDDKRPPPEAIPNGEECHRIEREILPAIRVVSANLERLQHGREGTSGYAKLTPDDAADLMKQVDNATDQIESDIDGLGSVRQG